jgi:hypothetical protein
MFSALNKLVGKKSSSASSQPAAPSQPPAQLLTAHHGHHGERSPVLPRKAQMEQVLDPEDASIVVSERLSACPSLPPFFPPSSQEEDLSVFGAPPPGKA